MSYVVSPELKTPPDITVLWRYMDFAKFMRLLEGRSLWFSRPDTLEDPREAALTDKEIHDVAGPAIETFARTSNFVCCWRAGHDESMAMWDIYGKGGPTIAVKSTVGRLKDGVAALSWPVYIAEVQYVDLEEVSPFSNLLTVCVRKAMSYRHESEVRMVIWRDDLYFNKRKPSSPKDTLADFFMSPMAIGFDVPVDLGKLITEVAVGPREPSWRGVLVQDILKRYGLQKPVVISDLLKARPGRTRGDT